MWMRPLIFTSVTAAVALTSAAVMGLVQPEGAETVPSPVVSGPAPDTLAAEYPQAYAMHVAYAEFRDGPAWFGAFAVGEGGAFGAVSGYADREMTRADALANCAAFAEGCRIVAEIAPAAEMDTDAPRLSGPQAEALLGLRRGRDGERAFAADARGYWGSGWGFASRAEAEAQALNECQEAQADGHVPGAPETGCRVIWASR